LSFFLGVLHAAVGGEGCFAAELETMKIGLQLEQPFADGQLEVLRPGEVGGAALGVGGEYRGSHQQWNAEQEDRQPRQQLTSIVQVISIDQACFIS